MSSILQQPLVQLVVCVFQKVPGRVLPRPLGRCPPCRVKSLRRGRGCCLIIQRLAKVTTEGIELFYC